MQQTWSGFGAIFSVNEAVNSPVLAGLLMELENEIVGMRQETWFDFGAIFFPVESDLTINNVLKTTPFLSKMTIFNLTLEFLAFNNWVPNFIN